MTGLSPVLLVGEYGTLNGGERSLLAVLPALQRMGWQFVAAVPEPSDLAIELQQLEIPVRSFGWHDDLGGRLAQAEIRMRLVDLIHAVRPSLIHANSLSAARIVGPVLAEQQLPGLGYLRDILKLSRRAIADINLVDQLIAVSQATRDWHAGQGFDLHRLRVIYNGVDSEVFRPQKPGCDDIELAGLRREFQIKPGQPVLLFAGQLGMRKGVEHALSVAAGLASDWPDLVLLVVGQRHSRKQEAVDYEQQLRRQADSIPQLPCGKPRVRWLGRRHDIPGLMRLATILVHAARQEPLGRVLLEAAASGLPVVATAVGGTAEILGPELNSVCLVPRDDVARMTEQVSTLLAGDRQRMEIGGNLRERAIDAFSLSTCAAKLDQVYRELLGGKPAPNSG